MASTLKTKGIILKMKDTPGKDKLLYILTEKGREMLDAEYRRLCAQAADYRELFGEEER